MVTTYQSFTTANKLLDKLIQRYDVPPHKVDIDDPKLIKLKVIQIVQYWIENNSYDFDQPFVEKMRQFISVQLPSDGFKEMALNLTELLNQKVRPSRRYSVHCELKHSPSHPGQCAPLLGSHGVQCAADRLPRT